MQFTFLIWWWIRREKSAQGRHHSPCKLLTFPQRPVLQIPWSLMLSHQRFWLPIFSFPSSRHLLAPSPQFYEKENCREPIRDRLVLSIKGRSWIGSTQSECWVWSQGPFINEKGICSPSESFQHSLKLPEPHNSCFSQTSPLWPQFHFLRSLLCLLITEHAKVISLFFLGPWCFFDHFKLISFPGPLNP